MFHLGYLSAVHAVTDSRDRTDDETGICSVSKLPESIKVSWNAYPTGALRSCLMILLQVDHQHDAAVHQNSMHTAFLRSVMKCTCLACCS